MTTAASVETLVLVLRLLKVIAMVFPVNVPRIEVGMEPDLTACLLEWALRTREESSEGERSAMERRWRGAKGEVGKVEGLEYGLLSFSRDRRARHVGRIGAMLDRKMISSH